MGNATGRQCTFSCTVCHILHASILPIKYFARQGFANRILPVCSLPIVYCRLVVWQHVLCTPVFCQFAILANTYRIYYITTTPNYYTSWTAMLRYSRSKIILLEWFSSHTTNTDEIFDFDFLRFDRPLLCE